MGAPAGAGTGPAITSAQTGSGFRLDINKLDYQANKEEFERQFLISALKSFNGRINQTALHANIPKKTLLRKLEKYGIRAKDYSEANGNGGTGVSATPSSTPAASETSPTV